MQTQLLPSWVGGRELPYPTLGNPVMNGLIHNIVESFHNHSFVREEILVLGSKQFKNKKQKEKWISTQICDKHYVPFWGWGGAGKEVKAVVGENGVEGGEHSRGVQNSASHPSMW